MPSPRRPSASAELTCPSCGRHDHLPTDSFCPDCGMPLVPAGARELEQPLSEAHERARKINPLYAEGNLVRIAGGRNQAEAELIQGILLEEGVPSMLRRTAGFDVPDFLAAGPRDVLVPAAGADAAREVLLQARIAPSPNAGVRPDPIKLLLAIAGGGAVAALAAWLIQGGA